MAISPALFSSLSQEWGTPDLLYKGLDAEYHYTVDAFASAANHKHKRYYDIEKNGLVQTFTGETAFGNPPYGPTEFPCKPGCQKKRCIERKFHADVFIPGIYEFVAKGVSVTQGLSGAQLEVPAEAGIVVPKKPCTEFHYLIHIRCDTQWWHTLVEPYADEFRPIKGRVNFDPPPGKTAAANAPFPSVLIIYRAGQRRHKWGKAIEWR